MTATDMLLERIAAPAPMEARNALQPIPWPEGLAPKRVDPPHGDDALSAADVVVMTFTEAEGQALADVLTPGEESSEWPAYTHLFDQYEPHLTERSPARFSHCLGSFAYVTIGDRKVLLFKSALHPATDDQTMPLRMLWRQLIGETGCELAVDTGTAGGVGESTVEGDVLVTNVCQLNYTKLFKDEPFAHERLTAPAFTVGSHLAAAQKLMAVNGQRLVDGQIASRLPQTYTSGSDESVDYFAFDAPGDPYGVVRADPDARMEEMDLGALALACQDLGDKAPRWLSSRCASDPETPKLASLEAEAKWAADVYQKWGYLAAVGSVICCWALVADLAA